MAGASYRVLIRVNSNFADDDPDKVSDYITSYVSMMAGAGQVEVLGVFREEPDPVTGIFPSVPELPPVPEGPENREQEALAPTELPPPDLALGRPRGG